MAQLDLPCSSPRPGSSRRPSPSRRGWLAAAGALAVCTGMLACGQVLGTPVEEEPDAGPSTGRDAGRDGGRRPPDGGPLDPRPGEDDGGNQYVDPECPTPPPPLESYDCDPFEQSGCAPDEACSPFVQYPSSSCESEVYGAFCIPAGTSTQGEACGSQLDCAPGFMCLITGAGTTCGETCKLDGPNTCESGFVCVATDVSGVGACY